MNAIGVCNFGKNVLMLLVPFYLDFLLNRVDHYRPTHRSMLLYTHLIFQQSSELISKLSYMGNSKSGIEFAINLDKEFYFASQMVRGHLYVDAKKRYDAARIILEIQGIQSCQFRNNQGQQVKGFKKLINTNYVLHEFRHNQFLQGQHQFPFSFKFFEYLPGSYEEKKAYSARVIYTVKAIIQSKQKNTQRLQKVLQVIIRQPQREGEKMLYGESFMSCKSCMCLVKGVSKVQCYFQKNYYFPGDECIIICEADNTKCQLDISRVKCQFIKEVVLTAFNGSQKTFIENLNTIYFPGVRSNSSYYGQEAKKETIRLSYKDSNKGMCPSTHGHYVRCQYYILVEPEFSGPCLQISDNSFKVYLTLLQPAKVYERIQQPSQWNPHVAQSSNIYLNYNPSESSEKLSSMEQRPY